jgi:hypothetical protein
MLRNFFSSTVYVRVTRNQFHVRNLEQMTDATVAAQVPFTTARLLIGQFLSAQQTLKRALNQVAKNGLLARSPSVLIHPLEMVDGGLSKVEERIFREVAIGAGASAVVVWVGQDLTDAEVIRKLETAA